MSFSLLYVFSRAIPANDISCCGSTLAAGKPSVGCAFVRNSPGGKDDGEVFLDICVALKLFTCRETTGPFWERFHGAF